MSMIRELRTAVRRNSAAPAVIPAPARSRGIVDCAIYRDGVRVPEQHTYSAALRDVRRAGHGFVVAPAVLRVERRAQHLAHVVVEGAHTHEGAVRFDALGGLLGQVGDHDAVVVGAGGTAQ